MEQFQTKKISHKEWFGSSSEEEQTEEKISQNE